MLSSKKQTKTRSTLYMPALLSHPGTCLFEGLFPSARRGHFRWRLQIKIKKKSNFKCKKESVLSVEL